MADLYQDKIDGNKLREVFLVELPIKRKEVNKSNSAKFKGRISIVTNGYGIIYDWKIAFTEVWVDLFATERWFLEGDSNFMRREFIFKKMGIIQESRPSRENNKLYKLDDSQIEIFNDYLNDRNQYKSTIKNIVAIIKGNNPGGEAKRPSSAEMVLDIENSTISNFVILLDDLVVKFNANFDAYVIGAEEIQLDDFVKLNSNIKAAFDYMQSEKDEEGFEIYRSRITQYTKKYNSDVVKAQNIAEKARAQFGKEIDKNITTFPFGFKSKSSFQKCHIYEFHDLRDEIMWAIKEEREYNTFINMIKDKDNFIPLPEEIHRHFDQDLFTYKLDGSIYALNEKGREYIKNIDQKFWRIDDFFMNNRRKKYFEKRNQNFIFID